MNKYKWSAKYNAFFPVEKLPSYAISWDLSDLVDISDEVEFTFNGNPPEGKMRGVVNGMPGWVDVPPPTQAEIIENAELKKNILRQEADGEISWRQDAVDAGIATTEEAAVLAEWKKYRVLLMRVDTTKPIWPPLPTDKSE